MRDLTEKAAATPPDDELWILVVMLYGHFNGPKRSRYILTDGDMVLESSSDSPHDIDRAIALHQTAKDIKISSLASQYIREQVFE